MLQITELEYCKDKCHYVAETSIVKDKIEEAIKELKKELKNRPLHGFRPGKAPDFAIKAQLKPQIDQWVTRELTSTAFDNYIFESKAKPIGYPQITKAVLHDSEFWCEFVILRKPSFELKQYKGFEIPKPHESQTNIELAEQMIQELRVKYGDVVPYEDHDTVNIEDKITLDRSCTVDGEALEGLSFEGNLYTVSNIEFDSNLIGMKVGETKVFETLIPEEAPENIRGKSAKWTVTVHAGMKTIPHPLNDELAKKFGFEKYDELHNAVESMAFHKMKNVQSQLISQQVIKRVIANHDFKIPIWLTNMEAQQIASSMKIDWDTLPEEQKAILTSQANDNVKFSLIIDSIREVEPESYFNNNELINIIRKKVTDAGQDPQKFLVDAEKDGRLMGMVESLRNEATIQWLTEQSKIVE